MEITKALCLSTMHIKEQTARWLDAHHTDFGAPFTVWEGEHGYFIPTHWARPGYEPHEGFKRVPEELRACAMLADANDCSFLRLDNDGPVIDYLPTFEW